MRWRLWRTKCEKRGHRWFPGIGSEFLCIPNECLDCPAKLVLKPWGRCLTGHPLADHYTDQGILILNVNGCHGPS